MLDDHTKKRKPAGDQKKHLRPRITIRSNILEETGTGPEEPPMVKSEIPDEEVIGLPEEWVLEADSPRESAPEKSADSSPVLLPEIHSAVKSAMKSALLPKPDFQKPSRRPKILPAIVQDDEPLPAGAEETPDYGKDDGLQMPAVHKKILPAIVQDDKPLPAGAGESPDYGKDDGLQMPAVHKKILPVIVQDDEPLPAGAGESPDYGKDQDLRATGDLLQPSFFQDTPESDEEPEDVEKTPEVINPPFCKDCGKKIPPIANFCPMCGTYLGVSFQPRDPKRNF